MPPPVSGLRGHPHRHYVPFRYLRAERFCCPGLLECGACDPAGSSSSALPLLLRCPVCLCMLDKDKNETLHSAPETGIRGAWGFGAATTDAGCTYLGHRYAGAKEARNGEHARQTPDPSLRPEAATAVVREERKCRKGNGTCGSGSKSRPCEAPGNFTLRRLAQAARGHIGSRGKNLGCYSAAAAGASIEEPGVKEQVSFVPMLGPSHPPLPPVCNAAPHRRRHGPGAEDRAGITRITIRPENKGVCE